MSEVAYLRLRINGVDVEGESTTASFDRDGTIECVAYRHEMAHPDDPVAGARGSRLEHQPVTIMKRMDRTSPLLADALVRAMVVDSAELRFFRAHPFDGRDEHYFTLLLEEGRVTAIRQELSQDPSSPGPLEEVDLTYSRITWTDEVGGAAAEHEVARP
ncbi:Hcp family type VI secretion system effector [Demequina mangrovi]|uniref:Type VI secretion system secreted protein Hcp n=1 Tax=Demequina mangrovi TaxID=1043493 RepID=A0A1H6ZE81_9MICO|nr:type VI secretion system tube protein TssD [Demequina mangrovi]SEJ51739.1 type VI secretion system secreted protein Hcp [Demequina mangrovi]